MIKCFLPYGYTYSSQREYNKYAALLELGQGERVYMEMTGCPAWAVACCDAPEEKGVWFFNDVQAVDIYKMYREQDYFEEFEHSTAAWFDIEDRTEQVMAEIHTEMRQTLEYLQFMLRNASNTSSNLHD